MAAPPVLSRVPRDRRTLPVAVAGIALSLALGACSGPRYATVVAEPPLAAARPSAQDAGARDGYTSVVPRAYIDARELDEDAPNTYTVIKGDTLWAISDRFLKKPWLWTQIWNYNPTIANPHLIYPGDRLTLEYVGTRATLVLSRNGRTLPFGDPSAGDRARHGMAGAPSMGVATGERERRSPRIRESSLDDAVPTIPGDAIASFLVRPRVVPISSSKDAPYVVGNIDNRLISAAGHEIYVRGPIDPASTRYGIYRRSDVLKDPLSGELLGHELDEVADARLLAVGDPSTLMITRNRTETIAGDILLPTDAAPAQHNFVPRLPQIRGEGRIISLVNAITRTGRDQVVVLNLGERSGMQSGDVLAIESHGAQLVDRRGIGGHERVDLPDKRTGVLMVFRTFEKVSYALVMESTRPIGLDDIVTGI